MKRSASLLALVLLASVALGQFSNHSFSFGGQPRQYRQYVPAIYNGSTPVPLVIALHGLGDDMTNFSGIGLNYLADTANFLVVTPQALVDGLVQSTAWNSGASAFGITLNSTVDDVGFINALIDSMSAHYNVDPNRIYACGFSMGAFMCHRLACELNNRIAAIAAVSGTIGNSLNCQAGRAVPVLHFHGTADATVSYTANTFGMSTEPTLQHWVTNNACTLGPDTTNIPDIASDGMTVDHIVWSGCDQNYGVEFFKVYGGDHVWLGAANDVNYTREIWKFFYKYRHPNGATLAPSAKDQDFQLTLFPNPSSGSFSIKVSCVRQQAISWDVIDLQGRTVARGQAVCMPGENHVAVDVDRKAAGLYRLSVKGKNWAQSLPLVIE